MLFKKLDLEKRNELRKKILKELENVPEGTRIKLDKKILDQLIFFKFKDTTTKEQRKIPVWTGEFLRKLDLSELSFENAYLYAYVSNAYEDGKPQPIPAEGYKKMFFSDENITEEDSNAFIEEYTKCNDEKILKGLYAFDFSYTNIKLNFSNIVTEAYLGFYISGCNFEGVDLSKSNYENKNFRFCNMKNTKINQIKVIDGYSNLILDCDLSDNDLSKLNIDLNKLDDWSTRQDFLRDTSKYTNTGLKIKYKFSTDEDEKLFYDIIKEHGLLQDDYFPLEYFGENWEEKMDKYREVFGKYRTENQIENIYFKAHGHAYELWCNHHFVERIKNGDFDGCYLNGKLIDSKTINAEPESYEDLMTSITSSIEEQKRNFGK